jgi:hypothetical protein
MLPDAFQLPEQEVQAHAILKGKLAAVLYHRAIRKRIGKRDPDLDHIRTMFLKGP